MITSGYTKLVNICTPPNYPRHGGVCCFVNFNKINKANTPPLTQRRIKMQLRYKSQPNGSIKVSDMAGKHVGTIFKVIAYHTEAVNQEVLVTIQDDLIRATDENCDYDLFAAVSRN